jgi:hypothetical protein
VNGATGEYLLPDLDAVQIAGMARGVVPDSLHLADLRLRNRAASESHLGLKEGLDARDLSQAGWGVIFAARDASKLEGRKKALDSLLQLRRQQAGKYYREFSGADAYRAGESKSRFLARNGMGPGPVDPERVPYYLLICAGPESIPFDFQYQLDVQYAVGRVHFETLEQYERYALGVAAAEASEVRRSRGVSFFAPENPDDQATTLSARHLVEPLVKELARNDAGLDLDAVVGNHATKGRLAELLSQGTGRAVLFTASHGLGFPSGDPRQRTRQGALLCQDWPGPKRARAQPILSEHCFTADDLGPEAQVGGLITFHFACYSAGTPMVDDFAHANAAQRLNVAPKPFVAALPQALLTHSGGGALASVGHVERAWGYSFLWAGTGPQLGVFDSCLRRLLGGYPIGAAMEYFNERYAELSTALTAILEDARFGKAVDNEEIAGLWTASNDAKNYVVIGDPAVRTAI